ncbi:MAG: endonuclease/exonuclease/phosphatase family protein [Phocaeicola sp.]
MGKLAVYRLIYFVFITFTILMLGVSILSYFAGQVDPAENILAAYIALAKPIFIIINVVITLIWLFRKRIWLVFSILGILVNYSYITSMFQLYNNMKYANETKLSVMTYNVRTFGGEITGFSAKEFLEILKEKEIDVICFQEYATSGDFTEQDVYDLYSSYFPYSFIPKDYSNAIYSKYPIKQNQAISFPESNNNAVWADIEVDKSIIRVINVHMQTTSFDRTRGKIAKARVNLGYESQDDIINSFVNEGIKENIIKRANQARTIQSLVHSTDQQVILCGDFNDMPGTYTYETLKSGLKDGFKSAGLGYGATYRSLYNLLRIDYVFHSPDLTAIKYETIPYEMSDHNPVYITVSL